MNRSIVVATVLAGGAALNGCIGSESDVVDDAAEAASIREALADNAPFCRIHAPDGTFHDFSLTPSPTQPYCSTMPGDTAELEDEDFPVVASPGMPYCTVIAAGWTVELSDEDFPNPPSADHCRIVRPKQ